MKKDLFDSFDTRERSLTDFLEKSRPPPRREQEAPVSMTASSSSIIANAMNNHGIENQSFLSEYPVSHLHSSHHSATPSTTTMPVVYHRHQQPSLIQVGGQILMQHAAATAAAPSQSQQVLSFIPTAHNNTTVAALGSTAAALGSTDSIFIRQAQPQLQQRYQQPLVLQQQGLTFMNPGNGALHSASSAHMYHDSTRNN